MPIREFACNTEGCPEHGVVREGLFQMSDKDPNCKECGVVQQVQVSRFGIVWTGPLTRYNDKKLERPDREGTWLYRRNTLSGKPEPCFIDSVQKSKEYARDEGLISPFSLNAPPTNAEISDDGKKLSGAGCKGQWI